jgi:2-polyprenyl-3-methyl-5-hydroxy-6-metoxy-1,4-benzoquinol methylase
MQESEKLIELQKTLYRSKNPTRRWLHTSRRDWIVSAIRKAASEQHGSALEIGPGSGIYLPILGELYGDVVATDVEESFLSNSKLLAEPYAHMKFFRDDISQSNLPDGYFDLVLCSEVIEHLADAGAALKHIHRILKPGGTLILSTPQKWSLLELAAGVALLPGIIHLTRLVYREPVLETGHINLLTAREVHRLLNHAGFNIREKYKSGMYLPIVAEMLRETGLRLEQRLERKLQGGRFDGLLWTQYYIAQA